MTFPLNTVIFVLNLLISLNCSYTCATAAVHSNNVTLSGIGCFDDEVACSDNPKWCIARQWVCDGQDDCLDGSDEHSCAGKTYSTKEPVDNEVIGNLISSNKVEGKPNVEGEPRKQGDAADCIHVSHCDLRMASVLDEFSTLMDLQNVSVKYTRSRAVLGFCVTFEYYKECVSQAVKKGLKTGAGPCDAEGDGFEMMGTIYTAVCNPLVVPRIVQHITCLESAGIADPIRVCAQFSKMNQHNDEPCKLIEAYSTFLACATSVQYQLAPNCEDNSRTNETALTVIYSKFDDFAARINCPTFSQYDPKAQNELKLEDAHMDQPNLPVSDNKVEETVMQSLFGQCTAKRLRECSQYDLGPYIKPALTQWLPAGKFSSIELLCNNHRYLNACLKKQGQFGRNREGEQRCSAGTSSQTATLLLLSPFCSIASEWTNLRWQYIKLVEYRRWPVACFRPVKDILKRAEKETVNFYMICKSAAALRGGFDCVNEWFQAQTLRAFSQASRERDRLIHEFKDATLQVMKEMTRQSLEEGCPMNY